MNSIKKILLVICVSLTLTFTGVAQTQDFLQGGKPPEKPKEREKEKPKPDDKDRPSRDEKKDKKKPDSY